MSLKIAIGPSSFAAQDDTPMKMLEAAGMDVVPNPYGRRLTEEEIIKQLNDVDGLIAGLEPLNKRVISSSPKLKAIARVGIGVDNVNFQAAAEHSVKVSSTPDGPTRAVAELTIAGMLSLCRQLPQMNADMHAGQWNKVISMGLSNTPVLFIGYGRIGRAVGELLKSFGPDILVCDPTVNAEDLKHGETLVTLDQGLAKASVITLHAGGDKVILDKKAFDQMRDGVILLNSARAGLVDEQAFLSAVSSGKIFGAWFDAFWQEPYNGESLNYPNVLLTPHVCTYTRQCRLGMETEAVQNLLRDLGIKL